MEIIEAVLDFNNDPKVQRLASYYTNQSIPEIFKISRKEESHSAFLAWLFTPTANHELGNVPLILFIELYIRCYHKQEHRFSISQELEVAILTRTISIISADVRTEVATAKGRTDIEIYCNVSIPGSAIEKLRIIIENKVYSKEQNCQTQRYYDYHDSSRARNGKGDYIEECLYIYLTPPTNNKDADCPYFVHLTYQNLLDYVLEILLVRSNLNERTRFVLNEYISSLSVPSEYINKEGKTMKSKTILAINEKERDVLQSFWGKYKSLVIAALTAISLDENASDEERKEANSVLQSVQKFEGKKYYRYSIDNQGRYSVGRVVVELIRRYININHAVSLESINNIFQQPVSGKLALTLAEAIKENTTPKGSKGTCYKRYFTEFPLVLPNGNEIAISSQWGNDERFENFLKIASQHIPGCEVKRIV